MRSHKNIKPIFLSVLIIIAIVIILPLLFQSQTKQIVADGSQDQGLSFCFFKGLRKIKTSLDIYLGLYSTDIFYQ